MRESGQRQGAGWENPKVSIPVRSFLKDRHCDASLEELCDSILLRPIARFGSCAACSFEGLIVLEVDESCVENKV